MSEIKRVQFTTISTHNSQNFGGSGVAGAAGNISGGLNSGLGLIGSGNRFSNLLQSQQINDMSAPPPPPPLTLSAALGATKSINSNNNNNNSNANNNNNNNGPTNNSVVAKLNKTFRHELELFEPDSESFPEFNFSKIMHIEKKKQKKLKQIQTNGISDPFEENDDDVARIAKEMEMKYGKTYVAGRRKTKYDEICDKGLGYDESDSFIDNTEAYDELIPDEVETIAGGFYINSGQLEFKKLTKYEIETEEIVKMVKAKKRILSTSSEDSGEEEENEKVDSSAEIDTDDKPNKKRKESQDEKIKNGHRLKKQKSSGEDSSSSKSKIKTSKKVKDTSVTKENNKSGDDGTNSDNCKEKPTMKTTTVKDMLKAKRDNYLKMQDDKKLTQNGSVKNQGDSSESTDDDSDSDAGPSKKKYKNNDDDDSEKLRTTDTKLPENLPIDILNDVKELADTAKLAIRNGKKFQFDEKTSDMFLKFDDGASCLEKDVRIQVFAHLEYQMQLPKYYLIKKAKQIRIKQEKSKTKKSYAKLKSAIAKVMPSVMNSYDATYKQVADLRSKVPPGDLEKPDSNLKFPRRKFPWNDSMRNLLFDLYQTRWTSFTVLRSRKEKFEDFVNCYLRDKVVPIWPNGWMKLEELQKELEKRKNQAKNMKESKKIASSNSASCVDNNNASSTKNSIDVVKESCMSALSTSPAHSKVNDDSNSIRTHTPQLSSATISPTNENSKSNDGNEVPQKLLENLNPSLTQDSKSTKSNKSLYVATNNNIITNNNLGTEKALNSSSSSSSNNKLDKSNDNNSNSTQISVSVDLSSPSKRTDHSISSIISNTLPNSPITNVTSISTNVGISPNSNQSETAQVINVDNLKNTAEILQTSNKLLSINNNEKTNCCSSSSNASSSSSKKKSSKSKKSKERDSHSKSKSGSSDRNAAVPNSVSPVPSRRETIESISSSSDSVEFIDEKPLDKKSVTVNKNKYIKIKSENNKSRSASPVPLSSKTKYEKKYNKDNIIHNAGGGGGGSTCNGPPPPPPPFTSVLQTSQLMPPLIMGTNENENLMMTNMKSNSNFSKHNFTETKDALNRCDNETNSESGSENKDSDLDVKQLIEQIKDLGEMNQSKINIEGFTKDMKKQ